MCQLFSLGTEINFTGNGEETVPRDWFVFHDLNKSGRRGDTGQLLIALLYMVPINLGLHLNKLNNIFYIYDLCLSWGR